MDNKEKMSCDNCEKCDKCDSCQEHGGGCCHGCGMNGGHNIMGHGCGMGHSCCGGGMFHHCGGKHLVLRWILGIIILVSVFCLGVKLGELKGYMNDYYDNGSSKHFIMMRGINPTDYFGQGMMGTNAKDNVTVPTE